MTALDQAIELLESGEDTCGVCLHCGAIAYGVEPDAEKYKCENCDRNQVYGCEEIILMQG